MQSEGRPRGVKHVFKIFGLSVWKGGIVIYQEQIRDDHVSREGTAVQFGIWEGVEVMACEDENISSC